MAATTGNGFAKDRQDLAVSRVVGAMNQVLKLTDAQVKEITPVVREYIQQVEMLKADRVYGHGAAG